jgi:hypothetical protein
MADMPREANRVSELSATTGTGTLSLAGALLGYRSWLAGFGAADTVVHYGAAHETDGTWEVGIGTFLHASNALQRDIVLSSSTGGSKIAFASGSKIVYCQQPAEAPLRVQISRSTDVGLDIYTAASQSARALGIVQNSTDLTFSVSANGKIISDGGISLGSAVAPSGVNDLSRHITLNASGTGYGFNVTSGKLNYSTGAITAEHDFYVAGTHVAEIGASGVLASLRHKQSGGYFRIGAYDTATRGVGDARFYYDANERELNGASDNDGSVGSLILNIGEVRLAAGASGNPTITWASDTNTGWWSDTDASNTWCLNGTDRVRFDAEGISLLVNGDGFRAGDGSATTPAFTFTGDDNSGIYSVGSNILGFATGGVLQASIGSTALHYRGNSLLVGDNAYDGSDPNDAGINLQGATSSNPGGISATTSGFATLFLNRMASNGNIVQFYRQGDFIASISITTGAVTYNTTSDARRKENERDFDSGALIDSLPMVEFDWKAEYGGGAAYGVLVGEAEAELIPTAFTHDEEHDVWQADYSKLVPILWREIRELRARVAALEA